MNDDELAGLAAELRFGPGTWFNRCQDAVAAGPDRVAGLAAQLEPGRDVRRALDARAYWPGEDQAAGPGDGPGPALSAAQALISLAGIVAGAPGSESRLPAALGHWRRANVLSQQAVSGADIRTGPHDPEAGAVLRRLAVLADSTTEEQSPAVGMAVLSACALRGAFPVPVRDAVIPVLFDWHTTGGHGMLRIDCLAEGPPGLYPDPRIMSLLVTDGKFGRALRTAWRTAPARLRGRCLVWRLTSSGEPCDDVTGGSLGGAFGVALAELARALPRLGRLRPRRLSSRCAVTAGLTEEKLLLPVSGLENKLKIAATLGLRVVLAPEGPEHPGTELKRAAKVRYAADLHAAYRAARTRVSGAFASFAALILLATAAGSGIAVAAVHAANSERARAAGIRLLQEADNLRYSDPAASLLLGSLAVRLGVPQAHADLVANLMATTYAGKLGNGPVRNGPVPCAGGAWLPGDHTLATSDGDSVTLWDTDSRRAIRTIRAAHQVLSCAVAADGRTLAMAGSAGVSLVRTADGTVVATVHSGPAKGVLFAPDGLLATDSDSNTVQLWRLTAGNRVVRAGGPLKIKPANSSGEEIPPPFAFSPDSRTIAVRGVSGVTLVSIAGPARPRVLGVLATPQPMGIAFSPAGDTLAVETLSATQLWNIRDPAHPAMLSSFQPEEAAPGAGWVAFVPGTSDLVTADGGSGEVWNAADPADPVFAAPVSTTSSQVVAVSLSPDGDTAAVTDANGDLTLWRLRPLQDWRPVPSATLAGHAHVTGIAFPDASSPLLLGVTPDGAAMEWNIADPRQPRLVATAGPGHGAGEPGARGTTAISGNGRWFASSGKRQVRVWKVGADGRFESADSVRTSQQPVALSANGKMLVTAADSGPVTIWNLSGRPRAISRLPGNGTRHPQGPPSAAFAPDGRTLAIVTSDTTVTWWDISDPARPAEQARRAHLKAIASGVGGSPPVAYSADGELTDVASPGAPGALFGGPPSAPALLSTRPGLAGGGVGGAVFAGDALVIGDLGAVSIWDVASPAEPVRVFTFGDPNGDALVAGDIAVSRPSGLLATTAYVHFPGSVYSGQTGVQLWNISPVVSLVADPVAAACRIDGGRLTAREWQMYAADLPRQRICG